MLRTMLSLHISLRIQRRESMIYQSGDLGSPVWFKIHNISLSQKSSTTCCVCTVDTGSIYLRGISMTCIGN